MKTSDLRIRALLPAAAPGRKWYKVEGAAAEEATVYVYDYIGMFGVEAEAFVRELRAVTAPTIHLRINSPGGNVFDAMAIRTALREHPSTVISHIDGLAASAATLLPPDGGEVRMTSGAMWMIHNPWMLAMGDAAELRKTADLLDKAAGSMAGVYARRTGMKLDAVREAMDTETWYTAEEAEEAGFVDQVESGEPADAAFDLSVFNRVPAELAARAGASGDRGRAEPPKNIRDFEAFLREAGGFSREAAKAIASRGYTPPTDPREAADGALQDLLAAVERRGRALTSLIPR